MKKRYGMERWRAAVGTALSAVVAFALVGAAPLAFAEGGDDGAVDASKTPDVSGSQEADGSEDDGLIGSAFKLGDVTMSCVPQSDGGDLAVGVPSVRTYTVTNEGERAYVRLASTLLFGELEHANESSVSETTIEGSDAADADEGGDEVGDEDNRVLARPAALEDVPASEEGDREGNHAGGADEGEEGVGADAVGWTLAEDGWWYRSEPLEAGESIMVRIVVEIPFTDAWVQALSTGKPSRIEESVRVEAVQARNMSIDLTTEAPWGDLEVEIPALDSPEPEPSDGPVDPDESVASGQGETESSEQRGEANAS